MREDGESSMEIEIRQYILSRFRTMSFYSDCLPNEYSPYLIRQDLIKGEFSEIPSEEEIDRIISDAKSWTSNKIIDMIKNGKSVSEIRDWCEYAPMCTVPIPPVNTLSVNGLLSRFDYFNYELNRIVREEEINTAMSQRKTQGPLFDSNKIEKELEKMGFSNLTDEFTRVDSMTAEEVLEIIRNAEETAEENIMQYLMQNPDHRTVMLKAEDDPDVVFSPEELPMIIDEMIRKQRFLIIAKEVTQMGNGEMWNLINNIEAYKVYRTSQQLTGKESSSKKLDNQMTDMLKLYQQSTDSLKEGYMFQIAKLSIEDLTQLVRLIQGYIFWKGAFYYLPQVRQPIDEEELARRIVDGFSNEHGMDPSVFMMFLLKKSW